MIRRSNVRLRWTIGCQLRLELLCESALALPINSVSTLFQLALKIGSYVVIASPALDIIFLQS